MKWPPGFCESKFHLLAYYNSHETFLYYDKTWWEEEVQHESGKTPVKFGLRSDLYESEQFAAEQNKNPDLVNLNVVPCGECGALAEGYALLSSIQVFISFIWLKDEKKICFKFWFRT